MEHVIERFTWHYVPFTDYPIPFGGVNVLTLVNTLLVVGLLLALLWVCGRRPLFVPGRAQAAVELLVESWDTLATATFDAEDARFQEKRLRFVPFVSALFVFILTSNAIVALPVPFIQEPTADLNCTLALGFFSISYAMVYSFYYRGAAGSLAEMAGPFWETEGGGLVGVAAGKASAMLFLPIYLIGEISRVLSLSFRLFGNILGGATIMAVLFMLARGLVFPVALAGFFIGFEAIIQAFVFSMLTLVFIAVAVE